MDDLRVSRAVLNGLFVWLVSVAVAMVPAFLYSVWRGAALAPQTQDPAGAAGQIAREVADLYSGNSLLVIGVVVITVVLIVWRASAVAKGSWHMRWANGLLVGAVPAVLSLVSVLCGGLSTLDLVTVGLYLAAGLVGGLIARPT